MVSKLKISLLFLGLCATSTVVIHAAYYLPSYKVTIESETNRLIIQNKSGDIISSVQTVEHPTSVQVRGDRAYVTSIPSAMMQEFDISDITNPTLIANLPQ